MQFVLSESGNGRDLGAAYTSGSNIISVTDFNKKTESDQRLQLQLKWSLTCSNNESAAGLNESGKFNQHLFKEPAALSTFNSNQEEVRILNTSQSNLGQDENYRSLVPSNPQAKIAEQKTPVVS